MAIIKILPSAYSVSLPSTFTVTNEQNMYTPIGSTSSASFDIQSSGTGRYIYLYGFNIAEVIPAGVTVTNVSVSYQCRTTTTVTTGQAYKPYIIDNHTDTNSSPTRYYGAGAGTSSIETYKTTKSITDITLTANQLRDLDANFTVRLAIDGSERKLYIYGCELNVEYERPINKVVYGDKTLIDLTSTTATADKILQGYGAFGANGAWMDGTATGGGGSSATLVTKNITSNGTYNASSDNADGYSSVTVNVPSGSPSLQTKSKTYTPTESQQTETVTADSGYDGLDEVNVTVNAVSSTYVGTGITRRSSTDLTASGATVTVPAGYYSAQATKSVASGSIRQNGWSDTETTTSINMSPNLTFTEGYFSEAPTIVRTFSKQEETVTPSLSQQVVTQNNNSMLKKVTVEAIPSGTAGTPTATKGTVSNHSVSITPSVTNTTGYITGSTKTGTAVTVSASELVSGTLSVSDNGTSDCTNYASVNVNIPFVTYYTGTTAPASSLGSNGDIYLKVVS